MMRGAAGIAAANDLGAEAGTGRALVATRVAQVRPVLSLLASLYLTITLCLVLWVAAPIAVFGWRPQVVLSGSMGPEIHTGDVILVAEPPARPVPAGSIVLFDDPTTGRATVHRVTAHDPVAGYTTKGDANPTADPQPVPTTAVRGEGRLLVPLVGLPAAWFQNGSMWRFSAWSLSVVVSLVLARPAGRRRLGRAR